MKKISILVVLFLLVILGGYFIFSKNQKEKDSHIGLNDPIDWVKYENNKLGISFEYPFYLKEYNSIIKDNFYRFNFSSSDAESQQLTIGSRIFPYVGGAESDECAEEICTKENFEFRKSRAVVHKSINGITFYIYKGFGEALVNSSGTTEAVFETGNSQFPYVWVLVSNLNDYDFLSILEKIKLISTNDILQDNKTNITCHDSPNYLAISRPIINDPGSDLLIKYKKSMGQNIPCNYFVEEGDFELKNNGDANYFLALEGKFLIMDNGTGVNNRGIIVYDLSKKSKVFYDQYSSGEPIIENNSITYWTNINEPTTIQNCPQLYNSGGVIVSQVVFDLINLTKKNLGNKRCVYQE